MIIKYMSIKYLIIKDPRPHLPAERERDSLSNNHPENCFSIEMWRRFAKLSRACYGALTALERISVATSEKEWPVFCATALIFCTTSSLSSTSIRLGNSLGSRRGEVLLGSGAIGNHSLWRSSMIVYLAIN